MDKAPKSREISDDEFPSEDEKPIRICVEPDCNNPCVKRGRGYAKWCQEHLFNHPNTDDKTKANATLVRPPDRGAVAKKAEKQVTALLGALQIAFVSQGDRYCAWAVGETAEDIASNAGILASDIKWVAKAVDAGDKYFAAMLLTLNVAKLGLMIGVHHDWVPYAGPIKFLVPKPPEKNVMPMNQANVRVVGDSRLVDASTIDHPTA